MTMKNILIFAALCVGVVGYGQKDTSGVIRVDSSNLVIEMREGSKTSVSLFRGQYYVEGDTMAVIKMLFGMVEKWQDLHVEKFMAVSAAMNFIDKVPPQYKKGKEWEAWRKRLTEILEK